MRRRSVPGDLIQLKPSNFASGGFGFQYYRPWIVITNADTIGHQLTFVLKSVPGTPELEMSVILAVGETGSYPVVLFQSVSIDTPTANVVSFYSETALASGSTIKLAGNQTIYETRAGLSEIVSSGGTVDIATGVVDLPIGTAVNYTLSVDNIPNGSPGTQVSLELRGISSSIVYAVIQVGSSATGIFHMSEMEAIKLTGTNNDSIQAHYFAGCWQATSP